MDRVLGYLLLEAPLLLAQLDENLDDGNDVWEGWGSVIFIIGIFALVAVVVIAGLWFVRGIVAARFNEEREAALHELAVQSAAIQQQLIEQHHQLVSELAEVRGHVQRIEQILREVE